MNVRNAHMGDLDSITKIVDESDLGSVYFNNDKEKIRKIISEEIHTYIHILAVSSEHRGKGYGKLLMHYFENAVVPDYKKIFLLVGVWNKRAAKLYQDFGYTKLCEIPGFYTENVTEILLVKER